MKATLVVPEDMLQAVSAVAKEYEMPLRVASDEDGTVQVVPGSVGEEGDVATLRAGGWIKCSTARAMADELGISRLAMGKLIDGLEIKIRACSLGCF